MAKQKNRLQRCSAGQHRCSASQHRCCTSQQRCCAGKHTFATSEQWCSAGQYRCAAGWCWPQNTCLSIFTGCFQFFAIVQAFYQREQMAKQVAVAGGTVHIQKTKKALGT